MQVIWRCAVADRRPEEPDVKAERLKLLQAAGLEVILVAALLKGAPPLAAVLTDFDTTELTIVHVTDGEAVAML